MTDPTTQPQQVFHDPAAPQPTQQPDASPQPVVQSPPPQTPSSEGEMQNPFVSQAPPPPPTGTAFKKILAVVILVASIIAVLFLIFSIVKRVLKKSVDVELTYWGLWEEEQVMKTLIDDYQRENKNVTITYIKESPRQYRERLQASMEKGTGPDIFRFHNTWVPMLKNELAQAPEKKISTAKFEETFYPVAKNDLVINGSIYGIPLEIDGLGLYYNEALLQAAGVAPPQTWEDLQDAAEKVTVKNASGKITTAGVALGTANNVEHFSDIVATMMLQNGADLKSPVSTEAEEALSFYRLFAEKPNNVWDSSLDNSIYAFASEKVAMIMAPSWQAHTISEINPELSFRILPIPQLPGANISWASYWVEGVSSASDNQEAAWDFLLYLSSKDALTKFYTESARSRTFGEPYSRVDLASSLEDDPLVGAYVEQAPIAQSFFLASRTMDNGINDRMIKYVEDAINSLELGVAPSAAAETMASGFSQVMSNFGVTN